MLGVAVAGQPQRHSVGHSSSSEPIGLSRRVSRISNVQTVFQQQGHDRGHFGKQGWRLHAPAERRRAGKQRAAGAASRRRRAAQRARASKRLRRRPAQNSADGRQCPAHKQRQSQAAARQHWPAQVSCRRGTGCAHTQTAHHPASGALRAPAPTRQRSGPARRFVRQAGSTPYASTSIDKQPAAGDQVSERAGLQPSQSAAGNILSRRGAPIREKHTWRRIINQREVRCAWPCAADAVGAFAGVGRAGIPGCLFPAAPYVCLILPLRRHAETRALLHLAVPIMVAQLAHTATGLSTP